MRKDEVLWFQGFSMKVMLYIGVVTQCIGCCMSGEWCPLSGWCSEEPVLRFGDPSMRDGDDGDAAMARSLHACGVMPTVSLARAGDQDGVHDALQAMMEVRALGHC